MIYIALGLVLLVGGMAGLSTSLRISAMFISTLTAIAGLSLVIYGVMQVAEGNL